MGAELITEIASFELAPTPAGNLVLQGGGKGHHAGMAVALALAWFVSSCLVGGVVDEVRLTECVGFGRIVPLVSMPGLDCGY